jgi:tetratricopeptide (TPR) repeat protein
MRFPCCLLAMALLFAGAARAEPKDADAERARLLYVEGKVHYASGRYDEAIAAFERSYALSQLPALLFNLAQAHRLAGVGHCRRALALYKSYLVAVPQPENEAEVQERISEMQACAQQELDAERASRTSAPASPPTPSSAAAPRNNVPVAPALTTGVGAALLVAGGVLYIRASQRYAEAEGECPCHPGTFSEWETLTRVSYGLLAAGGVTTAAGLGWWIAITPDVEPRRQEAVLRVSGRF